jgi:hypothetical protein
MKPTIGRIVHYRLSKQDAEEIASRRGLHVHAHEILRGNRVEEGDTFPAMIVRTWGDQPTSAVQLQVFLDGNDTHWATSVQVGEGPRTFSWPTRD